MRWLAGLWRTPEGQKGDPAGFRRNQAGHMLVGVAGALALGWTPWAAAPVAAGYAVWEITQFRNGAEPWDALADWAFVAAGAVLAGLALAGRWGAAALLLAGLGVALWLGGRARAR